MEQPCFQFPSKVTGGFLKSQIPKYQPKTAVVSWNHQDKFPAALCRLLLPQKIHQISKSAPFSVGCLGFVVDVSRDNCLLCDGTYVEVGDET